MTKDVISEEWNIAQISLIDSGLLFEHVSNGCYNFVYIDREQSEAILETDIDFTANPPIHRPPKVSSSDTEKIRAMIMRGYPIREYRNPNGELSYKCEEAYVYLDNDLNKDVLYNILIQMRVFGVVPIFLAGNVFTYKYLEEVILFLKQRNAFLYVVCNQKYMPQDIPLRILQDVDYVLIDHRNMSVGQLEELSEHLCKLKPHCSVGLYNTIGFSPYMEGEQIRIDSYPKRSGISICKDHMVLYINNNSRAYEYAEQISIAKNWWDFIKVIERK